MKLIPDYKHQIAAHCESGSTRNLLNHEGVEISEALVFGIGSGPFFGYLWFMKTVASFPLVVLRAPLGEIIKNVMKEGGIGLFRKEFESTDEAIARVNERIDAGRPVAVSVDMFYMKYLPEFMHVHTPAHFIVLVGRDGDTYAVSDPYSDKIDNLDISNLRLALSTKASMSPNNLVLYIEKAPAGIDWKKAVKSGISRTVNRMLMLPVIRNIISIIGFEGINTFAKKIPQWPDKYKGFDLREGILYMAVIFEDQGTGGGAFRLMYGAFLQEVADMFDSDEFKELSGRMIENGKAWREASRMLMRSGRKLPIRDEEYPDWMAQHGKTLKESLKDISSLYRERAAFEKVFFKDLKKANRRLKA